MINYSSYTFSSCFMFVRVFVVLFARVSRFNVMISVLITWFFFTFDTVCLILFFSCVLSFSFISPFVLCFPSVSNFYFTSQYHQFPLSHAAAAIHTYPRAAAAATTTTTTLTMALTFHPKHEKHKQKR